MTEATMGLSPVLILLIGLAFIIYKGIKIVPQQQIWIVERFGKFNRKLEAGLNFIVPLIDKVSYKHSLKEIAIDVAEQTAITSDNVTLIIDGIIYLKIVDPVSTSYGVDNAFFALSQLAQTTMRSEIGKIELDRTFEEREILNANIVKVINEAAINWGLQCMRYEIKDITPPASVKEAMELQVAAERKKRAQILDSEGDRQSEINIAEAKKRKLILESEGSKQAEINKAEAAKQSQVLASEATMVESVNEAKGEAEAILEVAKAKASSLKEIAGALNDANGKEAASLKVAEKYVEAFSKMTSSSNTILLPTNAGDINSVVTQAFSVIETLKK